ncbi:MFS transporter [Amnibacterium sp. CER49]|uniref:MFS transporter n=1 Tax=Amnibacterium sp. CER49 TaxID=3039161 RepID=UPI002448B3D5|nr:MFS transporter [Amnibacterium sp. CER49]MDH2443411.1 MFS transporter [Amnibacterium sp. CER49]
MRFLRTGTTWVRYGQLGLVAFVIDGYAPTVRLIGRDLRVPLALAALHATAFGIGFMLGPFATTWLTARVGRVATAWIGAAGLCAGVLLYLAGGVLPVTMLGIAVAGFGGTLVQSAAFADLAVVHGPNGPRALSEGAAVSQAAGVVAPLAVGAASATVLGWRAAFAVVLALAALLGLLGAVGSRRAATAGDGARQSRPAPIRRRLPGRFWGVWCSFAVVLGVEFCLSVWAPVLLAARHVPDALATASLALMLTGIMVGRLLIGPLTRRLRVDVLLLASIAVSLAGFAVFWTATQGWLAVAALGVAGLGIAGQSPLSLARLVAASDDRPDDASASASFALGIAIAGAPPLVGALGDLVGVRVGLLLVPALGVVAAVLVLLTPTGPAPVAAASPEPA